MPDFDIDNLKKTWQEQTMPEKYEHSEIVEMLNRKSRNYVKYIFWISAAEFLLFFGISIFTIFQSEDSNGFMNILTKLGVHSTFDIEKNLAHLYFFIKILSLLITGFFALKFYRNYIKINVESNLKKFIHQIIDFRKTVNLFIFINVLMLILFTVGLISFIFHTLAQQEIHLNQSTLAGFIVGIVISTLLSVGIILLYYRIAYGIIMRRLGRNLKQLQKIEEESQ